MSDAWFIAGAVTVWIIGSLVGYYYMVRHAHRSPFWLLLALGLGPFAILIFMERVEAEPIVIVHGKVPDPASSGRTTIVVGIDGSPDSQRSLDIAMRTFDSPQHLFVLCEAIDYDEGDDVAGAGVAAATRRLEQTVARSGRHDTLVEVVAGTPVDSLMAVADRHQASVIVVGTRGRGMSRRLLGSVAEGLLARSAQPILVVAPSANV